MKTFYKFLKAIVKISFRIFYPKTEIVNKEGFNYAAPAIIISNHPNTLIDPLNCAARSKEQVHFLANAGLFATPFTNWLFNKLYCVPIQRRIDTKGKPTNNKEAFARCDAFLGDGGVLWIAPEGGSLMGRMLHPFKTGSARIALSAEDKKDFNLNMRIIPVGLNYDKPYKFRSSLLVNVGEAIAMKDYEQDYRDDPIKTVRAITAILQEKVRDLVIDTQNETEDTLVLQLQELYANSAPLSLKDSFSRTKEVIRQLRALEKEAPIKATQLQEQSTAYFERLAALGISDAGLAWFMNGKTGNILFKLIGLIIGFPFFLYGWLNNWLAAGIPGLLARNMKVYPAYEATIKIVASLLTFPLFYFIQYKIIGLFFDSPWTWIYLLSLPIMGLFALWYWDQTKIILPELKVWTWNSKEKENLIQARRKIWEELSNLFTLTKEYVKNS